MQRHAAIDAQRLPVRDLLRHDADTNAIAAAASPLFSPVSTVSPRLSAIIHDFHVRAWHVHYTSFKCPSEVRSGTAFLAEGTQKKKPALPQGARPSFQRTARQREP